MKKFGLALFLMMTGFLAQAQENPTTLIFAQNAVQAQAVWLVGPQDGDESVLQLNFTNGGTQNPQNLPGSLQVALFMPDMGHGSAPTAVTQTLGGDGQPVRGSYTIRGIYFLMPGLWQVKVTLGNTTTSETQIFTVTIP